MFERTRNIEKVGTTYTGPNVADIKHQARRWRRTALKKLQWRRDAALRKEYQEAKREAKRLNVYLSEDEEDSCKSEDDPTAEEIWENRLQILKSPTVPLLSTDSEDWKED